MKKKLYAILSDLMDTGISPSDINATLNEITKDKEKTKTEAKQKAIKEAEEKLILATADYISIIFDLPLEEATKLSKVSFNETFGNFAPSLSKKKKETKPSEENNIISDLLDILLSLEK